MAKKKIEIVKEIEEVPAEVREKVKETAKKRATRHKKKKKFKTQSERTKARKTRMSPEDREKVRATLVTYFGAKVVEKALSQVTRKDDEQSVLIELKYRMEREIEEQELEVAEYFKKIDAEFRSVGRPKSVFNWREMEYLCSIGCTLEEIAGFFQLASSTVMEKVKEEYGLTFNQYYERHSQGIKVALRRRQLRAAMDGDTQMLKFLGKNILGQKEKVDFDGQVKVNSWVDLVKNLGNGDAAEITGEQGDE